MLFREVFAGWAKRVRVTNAVALQVALQNEPLAGQMRVAQFRRDIDAQLDADPQLKKIFATVKITLPTDL